MIKKTKRIYRLADISIEEIIIPRHLSLCNGSHANKNTSILKEKYTHLIHSLIRRIIANDEGVAYMNAEIMKSLYGNDYSVMIRTLCDELHCFSRNFYEVGKHSYEFSFMDPRIKYETTYEYPYYLDKYENRLDNILAKRQEENEIKAIQSMGTQFWNDYMQSLGMLRMTYKELAEQFIFFHHFPTQEQYDHYLQIIEEYTNLKKPHIKTDQNDRIYHILTRTPRLLKPFLNIKFACDIHNSHPLLFVSKIYDYHAISITLRQRINAILDDISISKDNNSFIVSIPTTILDVPFNLTYTVNSSNPSHVPQYIYEFVYNRLENNNLDLTNNVNGFKSISYDELFYILLVSKGVFWDFIIPSQICNESGLTRSDVKVLLFQELFYSNIKGLVGKKYAGLFLALFPNVFALLEQLKFGTNHDDQKPSAWLSGEMMKLESSLFREILKQLYRKRYRAINIHDAIVVLNVKGNGKCTENEVCGIIRQVYWEHGLLANVGVDYYGKNHAMECVEQEKMNGDRIEQYIIEQKEKAANGNQNSSNFIKQYEKGKLELIPGQDKSSLMPHPTKRKPRKRRA